MRKNITACSQTCLAKTDLLMIYLACTKQHFIPTDTAAVRWLDRDADEALAQAYWQALGQELRRSTWRQAHEFGYQYAALVMEGRIVSCAAAWRFLDEAWEVAAVGTLPDYRRRGYAKRVIAFVTAAILAAGRLATCSTSDGNVAMAAAAKSVGFYEVPRAEVWWSHPQLPDFLNQNRYSRTSRRRALLLETSSRHRRRPG
jgi:predicted GNAT family acetyltransferase